MSTFRAIVCAEAAPAATTRAAAASVKFFVKFVIVAPSSDICLTEPEVAWEHCLVSPRDGRYHILDRHTSAGTYVNGMRTLEHSLEAGDQISIGETTLIYREDAPLESDDSPQHTLMRACSLVFLFRALAVSHSGEFRGALEDQLLRLIGRLVPSSGGAVP